MRCLGLVACLVLMCSYLCQGAAFEPAFSTADIKTDWERQITLRQGLSLPSPSSDAVGGCDGIINGKWGFHTEREMNPWWQVDFNHCVAIGHIRIFNRCEGDFQSRAAGLVLLLSEDNETWREVYRHNGDLFGGYLDNNPLTILLEGEAARYVRIMLPYEEYLHLDEVEVYSPGGEENLALGKTASQSSVSRWSVAHDTSSGGYMSLDRLIQRGYALIESLKRMNTNLSAEIQAFETSVSKARQLATGLSRKEQESIRFELLSCIRSISLRNPLLDFEEILFVKRPPTLFPHVSDQYYGWFAQGGGGIYILSGFKGDNPKIRCLTEDWPEGNFLRPELSFDARKILFAYSRYYPQVAEVKDKTLRENLPEDSFYHLFEMDLVEGTVRQLTFGRYNDFDARYLPNGDIVFLSTRKGIALQAGRDSAQATMNNTLPESYVRCGGNTHRPVPVFTLHRMDKEGANLCAISAFENFEWTPSITHDGEILYARWDYIDRFNGDYMSLWTTRPDGTNAQLVYGNFTSRPQCVFEARVIPNSRKIVFTATAHHSITGGSLVLLDRTRGTEYEEPLQRLTPDVCFPETECWPDHYYAGPWPLSEEFFLVSWSTKPLPAHAYMNPNDETNPRNAMGIYLYDAFGNLTLLYRDPLLSSETPIPLKPRKIPFLMADMADTDQEKTGILLVQNVYEGMAEIPRGSVVSLRIVGVIPKVQPFMNEPNLGVSAEDPGKFILGTVPVEKDGSAYFVVPSGIPVFFQALDHHHMAVRTMRSLTYVQPGTSLSCVGCHEPRDTTPTLHVAPTAMRRPPSRIKPEAPGTWPLRFDVLVQPVLDTHCVRCHRPGYENSRAAAIDLTSTHAYETLIHYADNDLKRLAFEKPVSLPGDCVARQSKLLALITAPGGHEGVQLDEESLNRIKVWMDTYTHRQGSFSETQEQELIALRQQAHWLDRP